MFSRIIIHYPLFGISMEIPGGRLKNRWNFSKEYDQKKIEKRCEFEIKQRGDFLEIPSGHDNIDWKSRGVN